MVGVSAVDRLRALGRTPRHCRKARQWTYDRARLPPNNGARACVRACVPACVAGAVLSSNRTLRSVATMHRHTSSCAVALALFRVLLSVAHLLTLSLSLLPFSIFTPCTVPDTSFFSTLAAVTSRTRVAVAFFSTTLRRNSNLDSTVLYCLNRHVYRQQRARKLSALLNRTATRTPHARRRHRRRSDFSAVVPNHVTTVSRFPRTP